MDHKLFLGVLAIVFAVVLTAPALAQLAPYGQDFEGLDPDNPDALALDGWLALGNVFDGITGYPLYSYGSAAPNHGEGFSAIIRCGLDCSCIDDGDLHLSVYSDYSNDDHANGHWIEANVFQEQIVGADDVGRTWTFSFDAKIDFPGFVHSTGTIAFIKTLDPSAGYALTNFLTVETTDLPVLWTVLRDEDCNPLVDDNGLIVFGWEGLWESLELSIEIDASLPGQILQFGFANTATLYEPSTVFYDNVTFAGATPGACCTPFDCTEGRVDECVGEYRGEGTTCDDMDCAGPLFITLCHVPRGKPANAQMITVGLAAAQAHLNHGDTLGPCGSELDPSIIHPLRGTSTGCTPPLGRAVEF